MSLKRNIPLYEIGDEVFGYRWFQKIENGQYKYICEDVFTKVEETCNHTSFYQLVIKEGIMCAHMLNHIILHYY